MKFSISIFSFIHWDFNELTITQLADEISDWESLKQSLKIVKLNQSSVYL